MVPSGPGEPPLADEELTLGSLLLSALLELLDGSSLDELTELDSLLEVVLEVELVLDELDGVSATAVLVDGP